MSNFVLMRIAFCRGVYMVWVAWETSLCPRSEKTRIQGSHKMEELGGKITEVFGNVSWNKESLGSGSVEVHQYHSADQYFILAKKKAGGSIRVRCLQL